MSRIILTVKEKPKRDPNEDWFLCTGCRKEIDPDTCGCGSSLESHTGWEGHSFVPCGCVCGYR